MFASNTLVEHLLRGVVGIGAFALAATLASSHPLLALTLLPVALVALRGCPMCWTMGLIETIAAKVRGTNADGACLDGSCALPKRSNHGL
jgi:hypothetical protein